VTTCGAVFVVDAGGCGGCLRELRLLAALDPAAFGTCATPRHATVLAATGPVTHQMANPLAQAAAALPDGTPVLAIGDCALDGGAFRDSATVLGGVGAVVPDARAVPGCPPTPDQLRAALGVR